MSTAREQLYKCTFVSRTRRLSSQVQAWDAQQAARWFREELEERGVTERGTIQVTSPLRGSFGPLELQAEAG